LSAKINVFLLAGNRLFREALAKILASKSDLCISGAAACSTDAISQIERSECGVLLIDPAKGESYDIAFVHNVARIAPDAKIMLIDMVEDESIFLKAVRAGVAGYLLQNASAVDVVAAVRAVHQGEAVCPPRLCKMLFKHVASNGDGSRTFRGKSPATLTRREQQLMPMIGQGLTNKEIASKLNLSEQTVKNHVHRILQRTGAPDRYAAVELAHDRSLLLLA
jgi:DNA-binding NarL/FixJ family response regulator